MVLGLSIGRKRKNKDGEPQIRPSPSLPSLSSQGIPWPENLVDSADIQAARQSKESPQKNKPWHKPFRSTAVSTNGAPTSPGAIASMYISRAAGGLAKAATHSGLGHTRSQRRRVAPTLNVSLKRAWSTM